MKFNNDIVNKNTMDDISDLSLEIDENKVANEILDWLIINVEQFIDNQNKIFKIDLIIDGEANPPMPETTKLQNLFRKIPDDQTLINSKDIFKSNGTINIKKLDNKSLKQAANVRNSLNEITESCLLKIQQNEEKLKKLYERMSFYYEMIGFYNGSALLREISGGVDITKFEYEAFSVDVNVKSPTYQIRKKDGTITNIESPEKKYTIQEGFTVWIEISFLDKTKSTSLF